MIKILALIMSLILTSCASYRPEEVLQKYSSAVGLLRNGEGVCTAFHVGDGLFVTAKHCLKADMEINLTLQDADRILHMANIVYIDPEHDVAIIKSYKLPTAMTIWSESDGKMIPGKQIITMGHPGYYMTEFTFEVGYFVNMMDIEGNVYIMSKNLTYPGESGGPVLMVDNGKVIGIAIALSEKVRILDDDGLHQHNTLSIILPWDKVAAALAHAKIIVSDKVKL